MIAILKKLACLGLPLMLLVLGRAAYGNSLTAPGSITYTSGSPLLTIDLASLTKVASTTLVNWQIPTSRTPAESGTAIEEVFKTGSGTLDFAYQFTETDSALSGGSVLSIEMDSYTSLTGNVFSTDVYYSSTVPADFSSPTSGIAVNGTVTRSSDGSAVTFGGPLNPAVGKGDTSPIFVVATNATEYTDGNFSLQDSGTTNIVGFAPDDSVAVALPMTSSTGLVLLGCISGFGVLRRRASLV